MDCSRIFQNFKVDSSQSANTTYEYRPHIKRALYLGRVVYFTVCLINILATASPKATDQIYRIKDNTLHRAPFYMGPIYFVSAY